MALDVFLADITGPVKCTLWDDAVHAFLQLVAGQRPVPGQKCYVRLENIRIVEVMKSEWNGTILTKTKVINSIAGLANREATIVSLPSVASSPFLTTASFAVPSPSCCISQFLLARSKLQVPFKATFAGMVTNVQNLEASTTGQPKRCFDLVDEVGSWIKCCAIGRNATSLAITEAMYVVVYFAHGRPSLGSSESMVLILKDGVVAPVGEKNPPLAKRTYIDIGSGVQ